MKIFIIEFNNFESAPQSHNAEQKQRSYYHENNTILKLHRFTLLHVIFEKLFSLTLFIYPKIKARC